jgi:ribosomal protein L37AE/L43A
MSAIDTYGEELPPEPGQALIPTVPTLAVTPTVKATELVERLDVIRDTMRTAMQADVDYGVIPGTNKPALLKPGAEKLGVLFQLDVQLENEKTWGPGDHLTVSSHATVYHAPTGSRLGYGEGLCTTREKKYAVRKQERTCPTCGKPAVIKGKAEYGGGWLCFRKKDGCGAKWPDGDPVIESQSVGEVENPDLPDLWNTVVKMAEKRARVDAVLAVTGASALFTQDVEDTPAPEPAPTPPPSAPVADESAAELFALLADDGPLHAKRVQANKGMEMVGANVRQRLRELRAATTEDALDALIARCHAAADRQAAKS